MEHFYGYKPGRYFRMFSISVGILCLLASAVYVKAVSGAGNVSLNSVSISPTPADQFADIDLVLEEEVLAGFTLFSSKGTILFSQQHIPLKKGENKIHLDITNLPGGSYHLNISNDKQLDISGSRSLIKR